MFVPGKVASSEENAEKWFQLMGDSYILEWIIDIAQAIPELEEMGIYHADIALRNTIRITHSGSKRFKIIDFDKAFKVIKTDEKDTAFNCTQQLIDFWLFFDFDILGAPF
jgi:predicted Ser/Thr protein kinase